MYLLARRSMTAVLIFASLMVAQSARPRMLFSAAELPQLQAKVNAAGTPAALAYASCVSSASLQVSGTLPSATNQLAFVVMRSVRRMEEVAFRYALTGDVGLGNNAKSLLLQLVPLLVPSGASAYQSSSYPMALAATYDMLHPLLTAAERTQVVQHLEAWIAALKNGSNGVSTYSGYSAATDNHSFAWSAGIAFTAMAIQGDSTSPTLATDITSNLARIQSGWMDAISPDGSVDEYTGYANYGALYALHAAMAAVRCGFGDIITGTNVEKTPRWLGSALFGSTFFWCGDSSSTHKGMRMDPVLYALVKRSGSAADLWALDRIFALNALGDTTPSQAFSPFVTMAIAHPAGLVSAAPATLSAFYRDNLNSGTPTGCKTSNNPALGQGGHALLHNGVSGNETALGVQYFIRDEWMNHSHEDDGNLLLSSEGSPFFLDLGYAASGTYAGAQSRDHNIVLVQGVSGFGGDNNNYYNPPSPEGRYLGKKEALLLGSGIDYVRGNHANMWMMARADRRVLLVKDVQEPYLILCDDVMKDTLNHTYQETLHLPSTGTGLGTAASPLVVTNGSRTLKSIWVSPAAVSVTQAALASSSAGVSHARTTASATGMEALFVSVHGRTAPTATLPLAGALLGTAGGRLQRGSNTDKVLVRSGNGVFGDAETTGTGRMAWMRQSGAGLPEWFAGECTALHHAGQVLLLANRTLSVAARAGTITISTDGAAGPALGAVLRVPFTATSVRVDGTPVIFTQIGQRITIGAPPVGTLGNDDRGYSFEDGFLGDSVLSASGWILNEQLTSSGGTASLTLKGGASVAPQPLALGMTVQFFPGAASSAAGFVFRSLAGAEVLRCEFAPGSSGTAILNATSMGANLGSVSVPANFAGTGYRAALRWTPATGFLAVVAPTGNVLGEFSPCIYTQSFTAHAETSAFALIDDVTLFSSEEDGQTVQGVVLWGSPFGRAGAYLQHPALALHTDAAFHYGAERLDPAVQSWWIAATGMQEHLVSGWVAPGGFVPASFCELGVQASVPGLNPLDGTPLTLTIATGTGGEIGGQFHY